MIVNGTLRARGRALVSRRWNRVPFGAVASVAQSYLHAWSNNDHNLIVNGETEILRRLGTLETRTVIDVGCHEGEWAAAALCHMPAATVHCFEPDQRSALKLAARFGADPRVVLNPVGLADTAGELALYVSEQTDISSMIDTSWGRPVRVPVMRGDAYVRECEIERVDFLKIDTEGFDLAVLQGFDGLLGPRLRVIQFEYNEWCIRGRTFLADFYQLLERAGYSTGKVHPNGVAFKRYQGRVDENWIGPACVAVHESAPEYREVLAVR